MTEVATLEDIEDGIDGLLGLGACGRLLQLNTETVEKAFEVYVLALCAEAVRRCGGTAVLTGVRTGPDPQVVVFRGAPGSMASRSQDFCYVDCQLGEKRFEFHGGVVYEGQSGAHHEIDVSAYLSAHAESVRNSGRMPRTHGSVIVAIECKFYESTPGVALGRTFVGLVRDCGRNRLRAFVCNRSSPGLESFLSASWAPKPFLDLSALSYDAEERFVRNVEQELRQWMHSR